MNERELFRLAVSYALGSRTMIKLALHHGIADQLYERYLAERKEYEDVHTGDK